MSRTLTVALAAYGYFEKVPGAMMSLAAHKWSFSHRNVADSVPQVRATWRTDDFDPNSMVERASAPGLRQVSNASKL